MYRVTKSDNTIEFLSQIQYVCKQKNGVVVCCDKDKSHGIISKDNSTIYSFNDSPLSNDYEVVTIEEVDNIDFMLQQQNDIKYMIQHQTDVELAITELYEMMLGGNE